MSRRRRKAKPPSPPEDGATGKTRTLRQKLLLAVVATVTALLCAEACVKVFFLDQVDTELMLQHLRRWSIRDLKRPLEDPRIGFDLKPDLNQVVRGVLYRTSSDGRRIPEHPTNTPGDAVRFAVVGDSSSFGWGVAYEASYPERFRRKMEDLTGVPVALANFSVPAYNSEQEREMFFRRVVAYEPDLVILHHDHNYASPIAHYRYKGLHPSYGDNVLHSGLIKLALRRYRTWRDPDPQQRLRETHELVVTYIASGPIYDQHLRALEDIVEKARTMGAPVIAVLFHAYVYFDPDYQSSPVYVRLHKQLSGHLGGMGYHVLDLYPLYQAKMREMGWHDLREWWVAKADPHDPHPNVEGHRFIADRLVEFARHDPVLMEAFGKHARSRRDSGNQ